MLIQPDDLIRQRKGARPVRDRQHRGAPLAQPLPEQRFRCGVQGRHLAGAQARYELPGGNGTAGERVLEAHVTDEPFTRPAGFDLAAHWTQSSAEFVAALPRIPVVVRANPALLPRMRAAGRGSRIEQVDPPGADGWSIIRIRFEEEQDVIEYCLSFGPELELLEPASLRAVLRERAAATTTLYR